MQTPGLYINNTTVWLMGTSVLSLTTKSGKTLDSGELTRVGSVLKFDIADGTLLDGYINAIDQVGYFAALEGTDGNIYAFCHQGNTKANDYKAGPMWVDIFTPADLTAPASTWSDMISNAANTKSIVYTAAGRLYTLTGSRIVPNSLIGSAITIDQTSTEYCANLCAFQLPVTPVTAIRTIQQTEKTADDAYYNLSGQRIDAPTKGIYIHNGKKVVIP